MDGKVIGLLIHIKHILEFNLYNLTHKITEMLYFNIQQLQIFHTKHNYAMLYCSLMLG